MTFVPATTPYAWPFDGHLDPTGCALVVCGSGTSWSPRCPLDPDVTANIERLRISAASIGAAVVLLRHDLPARVSHCAGPTQTPLETRDGEIAVRAAGIDGFYGSPLDSVLRSQHCGRLLLVGHGFETTVHSTLRRANDRGYECLTISDACAVIDPSLRAASISTIEMSGGIFGAVGSTDEVIQTLDLTQSEYIT